MCNSLYPLTPRGPLPVLRHHGVSPAGVPGHLLVGPAGEDDPRNRWAARLASPDPEHGAIRFGSRLFSKSCGAFVHNMLIFGTPRNFQVVVLVWTKLTNPRSSSQKTLREMPQTASPFDPSCHFDDPSSKCRMIQFGMLPWNCSGLWSLTSPPTAPSRPNWRETVASVRPMTCSWSKELTI